MKKKSIPFFVAFTLIATGLIAQDNWTQKANFIGQRYGTIHFSIGDKGYVGTGTDDVSIKSDFWEFDPVANTWTQKADFGGGIRAYGTGFTIGNKGYAGTGIVASYDWRKDMWEYDPGINTWRRVADFAPGFRSDYGGGLRYSAVGFSIGNKGYMGTGNYRISPSYDAIYLNDFWEFDPNIGDSGTWTRKADVPEQGRHSAIGLSIGNKGYIGLGYYYYDTRLKDFWEYDQVTNIWTRKADFGGIQRVGAAAFTIGNKGYVGTGWNYSGFNDLWQYNPANNEWVQKATFPGTIRYMAASFSIGSKGYMGLGGNNTGALNGFWEYNPFSINICNQTWMLNNLNVTTYRNGDAIPQVTDPSEWNSLTTGAWCYYNNDPSSEAEYGKLYNWYAVNDPRGLAPAGWHIPNNAEWITLENCAGGYFTSGGALKESGTNHWASPNNGASNSSGFTALPGGIRQGGGSFASMGSVGNWWSASAGQKIQYGIVIQGGYYRSLFYGSTIFYGNENFIGYPDKPIADFKTGMSVRCVKDCILAFSLHPSDTTVNTPMGSCSKIVNYTAIATGTETPTITFTFTGATLAAGSGTGSGQSFNKGITNVTLTATNNCGTATSIFNVTVVDNIAPEISCLPTQNLCFNTNNNYIIQPLTSSDNCGIKSIAYNITGATNRSGTGPNASGSFNSGISTIKWIVMDSSGNSSSCQSTIQIYPRLNVTIPDSYGAVFGRPNTIYIGYGWYLASAQELFGNGFNAMILLAIPSGGTPFQLHGIPYYHYRWSNGSTLPAIIISHPVAGNYTYSVTITDAKGCEVTVQKTIRVIDVRCTKTVYGINIPGALVCRPGNKQKCVYKFQVWAELLGNAEIGPCGVHVPQTVTANQGIGKSITNMMNANSENSWSQKNDFPGNGRYGAISFGIGKKGYMGLGSGRDTLFKDFWEFDPSNNVWTQKADFGGSARALSTAFSLNNKGYVGTGLDNDGLRRDFWEYSPSTNTWNQKADFAGDPRVYSTGFSIESKGYIGTGYDIYDRCRNDFWEYNPATNNWIQKADFGGTARYMASGFSIGNKGYIGTGIDIERLRNDFWEYNPATNKWLRKADFAGADRYMTTGLRIGNKGYIGLGYDTSNTFKNDFWEYNPTDNIWIRQADFAGGVRVNATGFSIGGRGYIGTGYDEYQLRNDFWEYRPNCNPVEVSVADVYTVNPGGNPNTIYKGYGPVSLKLTAVASGGFADEQFNYTYNWSTGQTTPSIIINPEIPGTYSYSVTVSDMNGCTGSITKTITVVDVRCGNKLEKVTICQVPPGNPANSREICVSKNAVAAHLNNGSYLGNCSINTITNAGKIIQLQDDNSLIETKSISINPNPNNGSFTLQISNFTVSEIRIVDQNGRIVYRKQLSGMNKSEAIPVNTSNLSKGIYVVQAVGKDGVETTKMVVQ